MDASAAKPPADVFDYVIVGAGSAGCVLANRLSADPRHTVLLLEAGGPDNSLWLKVPIGYGHSFFNPAVNWMYRTEPDPQLGGRCGYWPRGKVLGGSSSINAMVFVRGQPGDFDDWAAAGNPGWGWDDVLPYFRRMEDFDGPSGPWRGRGGPLHVSDVSAQVHSLCARYLQAAGEIGLPFNPDLNGSCPEGVGINQITTRAGWRESSATAYLRPARRRPNLEVRTRAHVTTLVVDAQGQACGAMLQRGPRREQVMARRELILAAGAIGSPQLLLLSGFGPQDELRALGIAPVADLPAVGRYLQDHLCIDHFYRARLPTLNNELGSWAGRVRQGLRYVFGRRGALALSVNQGGGFVRSSPHVPRPDLQLYFSPLSYLRASPGRRRLMAPDPYPGFMLSVQPCRPSSRGSIRLRSPDPAQAPLIEPNSLDTEKDRQELLEGARLMRRLSTAPALRELIEAELHPGPQVQGEQDLLADVRARASTVFHPAGTCRMGPDRRAAVVDARLRVHGQARLRVVDASVFPNLTSGNLNAPTLMLAERASDLILADAA
jgi:choline dehydrogenase